MGGHRDTSLHADRPIFSAQRYALRLRRLPVDCAGVPIPPRRPVLAILMALVLSGAWVAFSATFTLDAGDFPAFYTGALMARHGDFRRLHDEGLQAQIQKPLVTRPYPVYFVRPHVYAAFLAPLALLPIREAFVAFILLSSAVLIGFWYWAYRRFGADAVGLLALFPVAIITFAFGQDVVLFLGLFVLSYFLFEQDRPMLSGFVLGLVFIKPHLMLLIPIALLVQRKWRMLAGLALAGAMEASASLALGGFAGASNYFVASSLPAPTTGPIPDAGANDERLCDRDQSGARPWRTWKNI